MDRPAAPHYLVPVRSWLRGTNAAVGCLSRPSGPHQCGGRTDGSAGSWKPPTPNSRAAPGRQPGDRVQEPVWEAPVVTSLTDAERAELSRKNGDTNKRSEDNARARGGQ